jgi:hypothetical protein
MQAPPTRLASVAWGFFGRRYPRPANPNSIIADVEDSGIALPTAKSK